MSSNALSFILSTDNSLVHVGWDPWRFVQLDKVRDVFRPKVGMYDFKINENSNPRAYTIDYRKM
jgi:hypothetical protein